MTLEKIETIEKNIEHFLKVYDRANRTRNAQLLVDATNCIKRELSKLDGHVEPEIQLVTETLQ